MIRGRCGSGSIFLKRWAKGINKVVESRFFGYDRSGVCGLKGHDFLLGLNMLGGLWVEEGA